MIDRPIIQITEPEVIEKGNETIYDYDKSHVIYKMQDLGSFAELQKMKVVNQQLKEQLQQKEDVINKAKNLILPLKTESPYNVITETFKKELLEILDNKGE